MRSFDIERLCPRRASEGSISSSVKGLRCLVSCAARMLCQHATDLVPLEGNQYEITQSQSLNRKTISLELKGLYCLVKEVSAILGKEYNIAKLKKREHSIWTVAELGQTPTFPIKISLI